MKSVTASFSKHFARPLAANMVVGLVACAAADDADDPPSFDPPPFAGAAQGTPQQGGGGGQTGSSGQTGQVPNAAAGSGFAGGAASEAMGGNLGLGSTNPGNGNGVAGGVGMASGGSASGGSASTPATGSGGAAVVGIGGSGEPPTSAGPGRAGAELCPSGPFGAPIPENAQVRPLFTLQDNGFFLFEGPVWTGGALYFSEIGGGGNPPPARINRYVPGATDFERGVIENSGSNGLGLDAAGNLVAATHDTGAISTFQVPNGVRGTFGAQTFNGQRFNSPNDLVLRGDGNLYFTDPTFQAPGNPQGATRVYRVAQDGAVSVVDESLSNPNGITLSPDGNTLYVTSDQGLRRYELSQDGTPSAGTTLPLQENLQQADGMTMDCAGNIYTTEHGQRRIRVFDSEGTQLASFGGPAAFTDNITNLAFGGPNRTTLFVTSVVENGGSVYAVETNIPGLPY